MSEECDFRTISEVPQSEPRASGRAGVSFTGKSIGGRDSDTWWVKSDAWYPSCGPQPSWTPYRYMQRIADNKRCRTLPTTSVAVTKRDLPCTTQSCAGSLGSFSHRSAKATLSLVSPVWPPASTMSFRARTLSAARVTRRPACADGSSGFSFFSRSLILRSRHRRLRPALEHLRHGRVERHGDAC